MNKKLIIMSFCLLSINTNSFAMLGQIRNKLSQRFASKKHTETSTATTAAATAQTGFLSSMATYLGKEQGGDAVTNEEAYSRVRPVSYLTNRTKQVIDRLSKDESAMFDTPEVAKIHNIQLKVEQHNIAWPQLELTPPVLKEYPSVHKAAYLYIINKTIANNSARIAQLYDEEQHRVMSLINKWENSLEDYEQVMAASLDQRFDIGVDAFNNLAKKYGSKSMHVTYPTRAEPTIMGLIGRTITGGDDCNREDHIKAHADLLANIKKEYDNAMTGLHKYGIYASGKKLSSQKPTFEQRRGERAEYKFLPDELDPKAYPHVYDATIDTYKDKLSQLSLKEKTVAPKKTISLMLFDWIARSWHWLTGR